MKGNHEDVIDQLNFQLSEKANKQIFLNETMNEIREVVAKITGVEAAQAELEQDMTLRRQTFAETREHVESQVQQMNPTSLI